MCVARAGVGRGKTQFSLSPLSPGARLTYTFNTHDMAGQLSYQNIDLVVRGHDHVRGTQFIHARGGRRGAVTLGRGESVKNNSNRFLKKYLNIPFAGNDGLYVTVKSYTRRGGWRFRACLLR